MEVKDKFTNNANSDHSIEWGNSTWNSADISIRNRYDNSATGKFNKSGSSEVPWEDFKLMISQSIERKHFSNKELGDILRNISNIL
jgi:hypothetical protein